MSKLLSSLLIKNEHIVACCLTQKSSSGLNKRNHLSVQIRNQRGIPQPNVAVAASAAAAAEQQQHNYKPILEQQQQQHSPHHHNQHHHHKQHHQHQQYHPQQVAANRYVFNGTDHSPMFDMQANMLVPQLNDGEILVKVRSATICLSDIHTVLGARVEPTPSVLGHEACVEIVDHRRGQDFGLKVGDRATFSIADVCGECEYCTNNLSQKCVKLFKYGHSSILNGTGFNGCYASHVVLRKGTTVIKLPDEIDDALAASINCALATMVNCVEQIPWNIRQRARKALIQGDGMLGLYGIALLKHLGFKQVYCTGHQEARRGLIKSFGAIPIINDKLSKSELNSFDCVIEVCGESGAVNDGVQLLKPGGAYLFVGMVHPKSQLNITGEQIIRKCLTLKGIHNYDAKHLKSAVEFLTKTLYNYPYEKLVSPRAFSLNELPEAIDLAKKKVYPRICVKP